MIVWMKKDKGRGVREEIEVCTLRHDRRWYVDRMFESNRSKCISAGGGASFSCERTSLLIAQSRMAARASPCSCSRCDCVLDTGRLPSTCSTCPDGGALCAACASRHRRLFPSHCTGERGTSTGVLLQRPDDSDSVAPGEARDARFEGKGGPLCSHIDRGLVPATAAKDFSSDITFAACSVSLATPLRPPVSFGNLMPVPVAKELEHVWKYNGIGSCTNLDTDGVQALRTAASHWLLALAPARYEGDGQDLSDWARHRMRVDTELRMVVEARFRGGSSIFFTCDPAPQWSCAVAWDGRAVSGVLVGSDYGYAVWGAEGWICSHGENDYRPFDSATVDPQEAAAAAMRYALQSMLQWSDGRSDE